MSGHCEQSEAISWTKEINSVINEIASPLNHLCDLRDRNDLLVLDLYMQYYRNT
ncbi:MAG: hypothetical protein AAF696_31660 [Bacteroidota bacterium]